METTRTVRQSEAGVGDILCRDTSHKVQGLPIRTEEEEVGAYLGDRTERHTDEFGL